VIRKNFIGVIGFCFLLPELIGGICNAQGLPTNHVEIDTNFPSGNVIWRKAENNIVSIEPDLRDTEGKWFYWCFRVHGAAGKKLTFNFIDSAPIGPRGPAVSRDEGKTWSWLGAQTNRKSFIYQFPTKADSVRFSVGMSYTEANLKKFLLRVGSNRALKQETLCQSRKGRAVERIHIGKTNGQPRYRVLLTCREHACEMMTSWVGEGLIGALLANNKDGKWFRENVEFLFIPFADKDGVEDGDQGKNRRPRDHNRDYDADAIYPETRAIQKFVPQWSDGKLRLALDLHCPTLNEKKIYIVGSPIPEVWREQESFGRILERVQRGPLLYRTTNNLAFGQGWNVPKNFSAGPSISRWAAEIPGVKLGTAIEFPYASVGDQEINIDTARAFGHDLARAIREYLEMTSAREKFP